MKKVFVLALSLVFILGIFSCRKRGETPPEVKLDTELLKDTTQIMFIDSTTFHFDTINQGDKVLHTFRFKNTGQKNLIIARAFGSCGCTVPSWPKEPILKGHSGNIHVQYDTKRPGQFTKTVTITSNAKGGDKVITIRGNVESKEQTENGTPVRKDNPMSPKENTTTGFGNN